MILVTGGTGFVGSHLLRTLVEQKQEVRAIKRANSSLHLISDIADKIDWVETDILDVDGLYDAMATVKQVYHVAAVVSFDPNMAEQMQEINVTGTANVVNAALYHKVDKFLYTSSIAALGRSKKSKQVNEKTKWVDSPENTKYAVSKYLAEREVWRGIAEGLCAVMVNPSVIIGEGDWTKGSPALFEQVAKGLKFYPQGGTGFVDVKDLIRIMVQLMNSPIHSERFVINGDNLSYQEFFTLVAQSLQKEAPTIEAKPWMSELYWRWAKFVAFLQRKSPLVTRETARMAQDRYYYNSSKIEKQLSYQFPPIQEAIQRIGENYLKAQL